MCIFFSSPYNFCIILTVIFQIKLSYIWDNIQITYTWDNNIFSFTHNYIIVGWVFFYTIEGNIALHVMNILLVINIMIWYPFLLCFFISYIVIKFYSPKCSNSTGQYIILLLMNRSCSCSYFPCLFFTLLSQNSRCSWLSIHCIKYLGGRLWKSWEKLNLPSWDFFWPWYYSLHDC